jgi:Ca2+-transporting ATPase
MWKIVIRGIFIGLSTLASFTTVMRLGGSVEACRTAALITLVASQLIHVFECRSEHKSIFRMNPFGNMKLVGAVLLSVAALAAAVMIPQLQLVFSTVTPDTMQLLIALGFSFAVPVLTSLIHNS